jgi:nitroimidazol reductase NimA-like FMN-containing flavoprotein (pyridoxamine 5'-phosphate oxidase superfamily)
MLVTVTSQLSPSTRSTVVRGDRARADREALHDVLASGMICHLGVVIDDVPRVLPTTYGYDLGGPDRDGTLYLHGSVAARSLLEAPEQTVCVTISVVDGLVLARSGFHHSMNYRSAVVIGVPRRVTDPAERERALETLVDHLVPGRAATLRPHTRKELAATEVLALPLYEASVKARQGDPVDDPADVAQPVWAGVLPVRTAVDTPLTSADCPADVPVPDDVRACLQASMRSASSS